MYFGIVGAIIHTHSMNAVLATLIADGNEFRVCNQEMIKGIKKGSGSESYRNDETLIVPIIENMPYERDLVATMEQAIEQYPNTNAVLVRKHGLYVWGSTWQSAKIQAECYDYLFNYVVESKRLGISL